MEQITFRTFTICMLTTASLVIVGIWLEDKLPEAYFKTIATFFIVGLANFLLWAPILAYRFLHKSA
ncbi:hypothetical protein H6783_01635 [Candidatus Nomurabacteria bacterium]|nr:hypothetical protein [Candidatus Nomurabacteria bacterium]